MPKVVGVDQETKVKTYADLEVILNELRKNGQRIVQCHGVFDLLHPGHIRHFREAKAQGDCLVVTVTPDCFVNKGPGRPVFTESLRLEAIAALADVDYVLLNDSPDAVSAILRIKPNFYAKGIEYVNHSKDVTGKISEESAAVQSVGGKIYYTDDLVFSSSSLLNQHFDSMPPKVVEFLQLLKSEYSSDEILEKIHSLSSLNVLVVGDAIIDEYQYAETLGQTGKGQHMVVRCLDRDIFLGGSLMIANHVAQFARKVTLMTALGKDCPHLSFIRHNLAENVEPNFVYLDENTTLIKKRYVLKDGKSLVKLFETYSGQEDSLNNEQTDYFIKNLKKRSKEYDLVLVSDFGNGFTNQQLIEALSDTTAFMALNTQTNSGNRGYNVVTNYRKADYISLNEPELRLSAHDRTSSLEGIVVDIAQIMEAKTVSITRGVNGLLCFQQPNTFIEIPAFATSSIDRIGAGDSFLSLSALCLAKGFSPVLAGFIGSVAAAISVQMIGNQEAIKKSSLCKFVTRLMK